MEKVHHHAEGIYKVDLGEEPKKTDNSFSTTTDNYKDNSNKNKMVNNGDSDDNNRNEENKNNTQNIILAKVRINILGLVNHIVPLLQTLIKYLPKN